MFSSQRLRIQLQVVLLTDIPEVYRDSKNTLPWKWHSKLFGLWNFCRCGIKHRCFWCCALEVTWNLKIIPWERTIEIRQIPVLRKESQFGREKKRREMRHGAQNKLKSWGISWIGPVLRQALSCDHFGLGLIISRQISEKSLISTKLNACSRWVLKTSVQKSPLALIFFPSFVW